MSSDSDQSGEKSKTISQDNSSSYEDSEIEIEEEVITQKNTVLK